MTTEAEIASKRLIGEGTFSFEIGKSENRVEKDPSYIRSRQIALKKFILPEREPWLKVAYYLFFIVFVLVLVLVLDFPAF